MFDIEKGLDNPHRRETHSTRAFKLSISGRHITKLCRLFSMSMVLILITSWFAMDHTLRPAAVYRYREQRVRGRGARTGLRRIQFKFPPESDQDRLQREARLQSVRDGFEHAWTGYRNHAWGHDEVSPVSGGYKDNFNGWGATMIDSLDTLVIMGFNKEFDEALEWIKTKFSMTSNPTIQLPFFETIIRYMGGFLGAYELTGEKVLLDKAEELGKHVLNAFQGSDFPNSQFTIDPSSSLHRDESFVLAEIGTLQLEFSRLSKLTGNPIYDQKGRKIFDMLGTASSEIPGLLPPNVREGEDREYSNFQASVGGMVDSYYEYLLKEWILLDGEVVRYKEMFEEAVSSIKKYMIMSPEDGSNDYVILGRVNSTSKTVEADMGHLACFISGSLAMGSKYFGRPEDLLLARQVAQGCYLGYHHSVSGLAPEAARFVESSRSGKFVTDPQHFFSHRSRMEYILRPETLESLWILYRLTGEKKYQDQAWEIFQSLERNCRTSIAYTGLTNVNDVHSKDDRMESFFLAETLKYLYLIFSSPDVISLDDFVLNTEAHPLLRT